MRVVHLLRKYDPAEWGGTETAIQRLFDGLRQHRVTPIAFCPRIDDGANGDPFADAGFTVKRFKACLPVWGISRERRRELVAVGGNLMSFDLAGMLRRERVIDVIHTHALGRLGAIAAQVARRRKLPFVMTIHGGLLDLPHALKDSFQKPSTGGLDWGKLFGVLLRSRALLDYTDAILTCNRNEAAMLQKQNPTKRIVVHPHGVPASLYRKDHRETAREAFPQIGTKRLLLCVGRIDPVKNQSWLIDQASELFRRHPGTILVLAGACTNAAYGDAIRREISERGFQNRVLLTGGLPAADPRLIGLFQLAEAVVLPSISETFGLVILEAWAAGTAVVASATSGASALIQHGGNGWLFKLEDPGTFHEAMDCMLLQPVLRGRQAAAGAKLVSDEYDTAVLAGRMTQLYEQLIQEKHALRHSA